MGQGVDDSVRSGERATAEQALETATREERWPALPLWEWNDTRETLQMWTQVIGKIRLALAPPVNHWWHVPLYVTARGLTTSPMPYGERTFEIEFDLCAHELHINSSDRRQVVLPLKPMPVASFYRAVFEALAGLDIIVHIHAVPVEVPDPIPFEADVRHAAYDPDYANRFWRTLVQADMALGRLRSRFLGKASPVHFFWGSFDLAVGFFSGRLAPDHPDIPGVPSIITREAYSHEVAAFGYWPGDQRFPQASFYAYAYPEPPGYRDADVLPAGAFYSADLGEFVLPYEAVRAATSPQAALDGFFRAAYLAAVVLGGWDREALERTWSELSPEGEQRAAHDVPAGGGP